MNEKYKTILSDLPLVGQVCLPAFADFGIDFSPLHSPNFGKRPSYRFERE